MCSVPVYRTFLVGSRVLCEPCTARETHALLVERPIVAGVALFCDVCGAIFEPQRVAQQNRTTTATEPVAGRGQPSPRRSRNLPVLSRQHRLPPPRVVRVRRPAAQRV